MGRYVFLLLVTILLKSLEAASQLHSSKKADSAAIILRPVLMPQKFYNQTTGPVLPKASEHLGFFCRKEIQFQQATGIPLFFRLGSKSYVDWMERKPNATAKN